jgi:hypothetical protein
MDGNSGDDDWLDDDYKPRQSCHQTYVKKKTNGRQKWTRDDEQLLKRLVSSARSPSQVDWQLVAEHFPDKSGVECQHKWHRLSHPDMVKGGWTQQVSCTSS